MHCMVFWCGILITKNDKAVTNILQNFCQIHPLSWQLWCYPDVLIVSAVVTIPYLSGLMCLWDTISRLRGASSEVLKGLYGFKSSDRNLVVLKPCLYSVTSLSKSLTLCPLDGDWKGISLCWRRKLLRSGNWRKSGRGMLVSGASFHS